MKLPKLKIPLFNITIPSSGEKAKYRPFLVKEEKILLIAQTGGSKQEMVTSLKQIINNCVSLNSGKNLDVDTLTTFDFEYLFLKIRSKSVNNIVVLEYIDHEDQKTYKFEVNLDDIELVKSKENDPKIPLGNGLTLKMKYPTIDMVYDIKEEDSPYEIIKKCMDTLYDKENIYKFSEYSPEEIDEFFDDMSPKTIELINKFFETMPKLYHKIEYKNSKGTDRVIELSTLDDFFTLD